MTHSDLPVLLRDTAENIHSRGPSIASAYLRSAADRIEHLQTDVATEKHLANECGVIVQERDATIADLCELLEFKRKEIARLTQELQRRRVVEGTEE